MAPTIDMSLESYTYWLLMGSLREISERGGWSPARRQDNGKRSVLITRDVGEAASLADVPLGWARGPLWEAGEG